MNNRAINFIRNFTYTIMSNLVSLIVSTLVVIIVPKLIGMEEYGYWQLYIFYSAYVGFLHFGWNDGIYLRYGGKEYSELDKGKFSSQFYLMNILQFAIVAIIYIISNIFVSDGNRIFIFHMIGICMIIVNVRGMLLYILQATNRITEYAKVTIMDRMLYCGLIILFLIVGVRQVKFMIVADLIGKLISLFYAIHCCREIVFRKISTLYFSITEVFNNINVGIKLMFSNIASMLIIGVNRFGIEYSWDVLTFGKVSLTLSVSNFMMLFINAVGIIMFPILRKTDEKMFPKIYLTMRDFLMVLLLGLLMIYYPIKVGLSEWLPQYANSLKYMALAFPMCVYEGKMALLINTYLKTLRKEKLMLKINLISLSLSIIITGLTTIVFKNLSFAIVSIVIILAFRCVLAELHLSKILKISVCKDIGMELVMTINFIIVSWFINSWIAVVVYAVTYVIYIIIKKNDIWKTIKTLKMVMKE